VGGRAWEATGVDADEGANDRITGGTRYPAINVGMFEMRNEYAVSKNLRLEVGRPAGK
jgi:hypothetical protein